MFKQGIRGAVLGLLAFAGQAHPLEVEVSYGAGGTAAQIRVLHVPAKEPVAAIRFRLKMKADAGASALLVSKPAAGPWSQFLPSATLDGAALSASAMAPATGIAADSGARAIAVFDLALAPHTPPKTAADLIDSIYILEAMGVDGKPLTLQNHLTTAIGPRKSASSDVAFKTRGIARSLAFNLARAQRVRAWIADVKGRRVATVLDKKLSAGIQEVTWDGNASGGRPPAPGSYLFHLQGATFSYDRKLEVAP